MSVIRELKRHPNTAPVNNRFSKNKERVRKLREDGVKLMQASMTSKNVTRITLLADHVYALMESQLYHYANVDVPIPGLASVLLVSARVCSTADAAQMALYTYHLLCRSRRLIFRPYNIL